MLSIRFPSLPSWSWASPFSSGINLPPGDVHDVEERAEKRARTLKHLIKANHINHSIIYNELRFHNHTPHILGSAYILGADADQLTHVFEEEGKHLESWKDSPGEIDKSDWRDYLGKREYQRAYIDFFEDQLVLHGYDWRALLDEFLLSGKEPLINNLISGLAHPLIHLGYAYELSSRTVAIEALGLAACFYNEWHVFLDDPKYTKPAPNPTDSLFDLLERVRKDPKFDNLSDHQGSDNIDKILGNEQLAAAALEYWNSWDLKDPKAQFAQSQKLAVALVVAADEPSNAKGYDFFGVHLLTSSHAVRTLLPLLPNKYHIPLVRQWWLFTLLVYIAQLRPKVNIDTIKLVDLDGRDWKLVTERALRGKYNTDAHFVKALRCMHECSKTWGDANQFYLKAAVKMAEDFDGWGGFGGFVESEAEEHNKQSKHY
ncbi:Baeyer-Villiger oxidase [Sphaerulina musiva]